MPLWATQRSWSGCTQKVRDDLARLGQLLERAEKHGPAPLVLQGPDMGDGTAPGHLYRGTPL